MIVSLSGSIKVIRDKGHSRKIDMQNKRERTWDFCSKYIEEVRGKKLYIHSLALLTLNFMLSVNFLILETVLLDCPDDFLIYSATTSKPMHLQPLLHLFSPSIFVLSSIF